MRALRKVKTVAAAVGLLLATTLPANAQITTGTVLGTVKDPRAASSPAPPSR